jgi:hypothetical protein
VNDRGQCTGRGGSAAIAPIVATVLASIDAVRDDGSGADDGGGASDGCADDTAAHGSCGTEWHVRLLR